MPSGNQPRALKPLILIPFAVLLAIHPLLIHGPSCGQDLTFHIQSWLDAASQLRQGHYPHWDTTAAWNAGEPRFLFYPPISWLLGAILTLIFPINLCPTIFIAIALLASGLTFHKLASSILETRTSPNAALIASTLYLANPYMLFTAFERSALAELLAAAWIPLLLLAALRPRPNLRGIAIPLALLWLTNAPAAVIGIYTLALLATFRIAQALRTRNHQQAKYLTLNYLTGTFLGLTIPAIYLVPAAYERRFIQTAMAIIPNLRYQDNFLFTPTSDAAHNAVNHTISTLAITLLIITTLSVLTFFVTRKKPVILSEAQRAQPKDPEELYAANTASPLSTNTPNPASLAPTLALLTLTIAFLLTPLSTPIWQHLPNLTYIQFPWRLLILLTPILALTIALLLDIIPRTLKLSPSAQDRTITALTLLLSLAIAVPSYRLFHQSPDPTDNPTALSQLFTTHHGFPATDEYTPTQADNDPLRTDNPAYWLAHSPNEPAPNTLPTAAELNPNLNTDDIPIPDAQTLSTPTPHHFQLHAPNRCYLILNLRDYPNWDITETDPASMERYHPAHNLRKDGLVALTLYYGSDYTLDITWRRTVDEQLGVALSILSLIALALTYRRHPQPAT
jgi:hypothetical protein